jgi:hypothetical protein
MQNAITSYWSALAALQALPWPFSTSSETDLLLSAAKKLKPHRFVRLVNELRKDASCARKQTALRIWFADCQATVACIGNLPRLPTISAESIAAELAAVANNYDEVDVQLDPFPGNCYRLCFAATTKTDVVLLAPIEGRVGEVNLGKMRMSINFRFPRLDDYKNVFFRVVAKTPVFHQCRSENERAYVHPNVYACNNSATLFALDDNICLGAGVDAAERAAIDYRLLDVFDIMDCVLRTHSNNPYKHIGNWLGTTQACGHPSAAPTRCTCGVTTCALCAQRICDFCRKRACACCLTYTSRNVLGSIERELRELYETHGLPYVNTRTLCNDCYNVFNYTHDDHPDRLRLCTTGLNNIRTGLENKTITTNIGRSDQLDSLFIPDSELIEEYLAMKQGTAQ